MSNSINKTKPSGLKKGLRQLSSWFERQRRILPWRELPTTYRVWISEIMLQQTQVATVIPYFEKFLNRFPTVEILAAAPQDEVLLHWAGLGYYSRARNVHRAAQQIVERGRFPESREEWLEIPGVGNYTAGAILSIALNLPEAILDGNVERVLSRVRAIARGVGDQFYKDRLWRLSRVFVEHAFADGIAPSVTNQALMELGATVCTFRNPKCGICPLSEMCRAHSFENEESFPTKKKKKEWLEVQEELHCVLNTDGRVLLRKREKGEWRAGLWDLLGDKSGLLPKNLVHLNLEEVGQIKTKHIVTRHKISRTTHVWKMKSQWMAAENTLGNSSPFSSDLRPELRWISAFQPEVAMGSALKKTLSQIRETFPEAWQQSSELESVSSR